MNQSTTIWMKIKIPTELAVDFHQLIRTFEQQRPNDIHILCATESQDLTAKEVEEKLRSIKPMYPYIERFDKF